MMRMSVFLIMFFTLAPLDAFAIGPNGTPCDRFVQNRVRTADYFMYDDDYHTSRIISIERVNSIYGNPAEYELLVRAGYNVGIVSGSNSTYRVILNIENGQIGDPEDVYTIRCEVKELEEVRARAATELSSENVHELFGFNTLVELRKSVDGNIECVFQDIELRIDGSDAETEHEHAFNHSYYPLIPDFEWQYSHTYYQKVQDSCKPILEAKVDELLSGYGLNLGEHYIIDEILVEDFGDAGTTGIWVSIEQMQ